MSITAIDRLTDVLGHLNLENDNPTPATSAEIEPPAPVAPPKEELIPYVPSVIDPHALFAVLAPNGLNGNPTAAKLFAAGYKNTVKGLRVIDMSHIDSDLREALSNEFYDDPKESVVRFDAYNLVQHVAEMLTSCEPIVIESKPCDVHDEASGAKGKKATIVKFEEFRNRDDTVANFKPIVIVKSLRLYTGSEMTSSIFFGDIISCSKTLVLKIKMTKQQFFDPQSKYHVFVRPYETMYNAISQMTKIIHKDRPQITKIFGNRTFTLSKETFLQHRTVDMEQEASFKIAPFLNRAQREAIYSIQMQTPENAFLLFGPPGTGKTTTLIEAVRSIFQYNQNKKPPKFLVCTPSNMAADNFALALLKSNAVKKEKIIRILASRFDFSMIEDEIKDIVYRKPDNPDVPDVPDAGTLKDYDVVISTIGSSPKVLKCGASHFSHIVIDEAGQATEPETLVPLLLLSSENSRLIMAGDPKQLGPVIVNEVLNKEMFRFDESLLMRLSEKEEYKTDPRLMIQLTDNHRSHEAIVEVASNIIYGGTLVATFPDGHASFVGHKILKGHPLPIRFHAVFGEERGSESKFNLAEIKAVIDYVKDLIKLTPDLDPADIGVIAPYKEQGRRLMNALSHHTGITVDTVEKFQGSERRVIIMTTTRTKGLGFVDEIRRFNTAITRARQLLIIVGHPNALVKCEFWKTFMYFCASNKCFHADRKQLKNDWHKYFTGEELNEPGADDNDYEIYKEEELEDTYAFRNDSDPYEWAPSVTHQTPSYGYNPEYERQRSSYYDRCNDGSIYKTDKHEIEPRTSSATRTDDIPWDAPIRDARSKPQNDNSSLLRAYRDNPTSAAQQYTAPIVDAFSDDEDEPSYFGKHPISLGYDSTEMHENYVYGPPCFEHSWMPSDADMYSEPQPMDYEPDPRDNNRYDSQWDVDMESSSNYDYYNNPHQESRDHYYPSPLARRGRDNGGLNTVYDDRGVLQEHAFNIDTLRRAANDPRMMTHGSDQGPGRRFERFSNNGERDRGYSSGNSYRNPSHYDDNWF